MRVHYLLPLGESGEAKSRSVKGEGYLPNFCQLKIKSFLKLGDTPLAAWSVSVEFSLDCARVRSPLALEKGDILLNNQLK